MRIRPKQVSRVCHLGGTESLLQLMHMVSRQLPEDPVVEEGISQVWFIRILGEEGSEQLSHYSHSILIFKHGVRGLLLVVRILDWFAWEEKWPELWIYICLQYRRRWFNSWVGKFPWRRDRLPTAGFLGFCGGSDGKESAGNAGDLGSIPGLGTSPGGENGNPLQYSCLENPHGQRSLPGYSQWWSKESGTT